uniref:Kazal-like domain-containing protein n=1 Tax=Heliothis virescens TaxID=7102 RepID=A0A2A4J2Y6_HELVI
MYIVFGYDGAMYSAINKEIESEEDIEEGQEEEIDAEDDGICRCGLIFNPVCGSDGVTYPNRCEFECEAAQDDSPQMRLEHLGPCNAKDNGPEEDDRLNMVVSKSCLCAAVHKPVCANNHQTYANMCVLHCRAKKNPAIKFLQWGNCHDVQ